MPIVLALGAALAGGLLVAKATSNQSNKQPPPQVAQNPQTSFIVTPVNVQAAVPTSGDQVSRFVV